MTGDRAIVDYKIVTARTSEELVVLVRNAMMLGWMPVGGMVYVRHLNEFTQTMFLEFKP